jgi:TCP-1/cpn60 chaperonin family
MLKMLLDPMGGIVLTNDGHAILREIEVAHPAAKSMIELSRTQDEEVGDGTTTVIILGRMLPNPRDFLLTIVSRRNTCTSTSTIRTKHTSSRHHFSFQKSAGRCSHNC